MDTIVHLPDGLLSRLQLAADIVGRHSFIRIVSHYDADGISSAGILVNALMRAGKEYHVSLERSLDQAVLDRVNEDCPPCLILSDMGSALLGQLEAMDCDVIVLDHHRPPRDSDTVVHVNPHVWDIDGMTSGCGASMCMLFAVTLDEANWSLLPLAFGGIAGDRQNLELTGINAYLAKEGTSRGLVEIRSGSLIPNGALEDALYYSTDPFIAGVSGRPGAVRDMLQAAGIAPDANAVDLDDAKRRKLSSLLALKLLEREVSLATLEEVARDRYHLPTWDMSAEDISALLNASGRTGNEGAGVALALGDQDAMGAAMALSHEYRQDILDGMLRLEESGLSEEKCIQYFYNENQGYGGVLCGIAMQYLGDPGKPTFALNAKDDGTRVSGRATFELLDRGVDLSIAMREASGEVGGGGGGHRIASGASIPPGRERDFLTALDRIIGEQISTGQ